MNLVSLFCCLNPLPHGVLASFHLTAGGLPRPPKEGDISREKKHYHNPQYNHAGVPTRPPHVFLKKNYSPPPPPPPPAAV
jgi:hypothetical protein